MKLRGLIIAIVVLASLTGALYWSNHHQPTETTEASGEAAPKILSINQSDISKIDLKKNGAEEVSVAKDSSGKWQITAPQQFAADEGAVSSLIGALSALNSERLVEDKATDLKLYGLAQPALEADVTEKNNQSHRLLLGDSTPTGNAIYAKLENDPRIFTVGSYEKTSLDKTPNDLRDKRLLPVDSEKISQIELLAKKQDTAFGRNKDEWQIVKPKPMRADSMQVENLIGTLTNAKMDLSGADDARKIAAAFATGAPLATVKVTAESGTQQLEVRKNKGDYYAKSSAVGGIYKVAGNVGQALDKNLDDFRNKKLFDFGFNDPDKIEIHDGSKAYFLTRGGSDWWNDNGKKLDVASVQSLLDKLRDLSATQFPDSGFSSPSLTLNVTSNDGKRVEKVLISKSGDNYIAERQGEPTLYELATSSVTDLEKAAGDLKPEIPASNPKAGK
jgi:Domain of unknown function (DUF4340)